MICPQLHTWLVSEVDLTLTTANYLFPKWNPCDTYTHGVNNNYNNTVAVCMVVLFRK